MGRPRTPDARQMHLLVSGDLHGRVCEAAMRESVTLSEYVRRALERQLGRERDRADARLAAAVALRLSRL